MTEIRSSAVLLALFLLGLVALLALDIAGATDTSTKTSTVSFRIWLGSRYAHPDSGDAVVAYPDQEADTTGQSHVVGSYLPAGDSVYVWTLALDPDEGDVWDIYANGSLVTDISGRYHAAAEASQGFISSAAAFQPGVVDSAALAVDAAAKSLLATGSGAIDLTGTTLGTSPLPATFDSVNVETHLIVGDSVFIGGNLITQSDIIRLGNTSTDQVTIKGDLITEDDIKFGLALTDTTGFIGPATFHDSVHVGSQGDSTTTHRISTGFFRYVQGIVSLSYSAGVTTETHDFPGATSDMVFLAWLETSATAADRFVAAYLSPGKITVKANATSAGARSIYVMGFKR